MKEFTPWNPAALRQSPLFAPLHAVLAAYAGEQFPTLQDCNTLLSLQQPPISVHSGVPLSFVSQGESGAVFEMQYEPRCYLNGEVQMRELVWHDLFNALVWLTFPKAKAALNARHYQALQSAFSVASGKRGAVRDMATLFDESGVIVVCSETELAKLLRDFQWKELFWRRREQLSNAMDFYLFGHGLYEKALQPYIGITGQGLLLAVDQEFFGWTMTRKLACLDDRIAAYLQAPDNCRSTRELTPVPLLGVPGWAIENDAETYYDNTSYFRSGRRNPA